MRLGVAAKSRDERRGVLWNPLAAAQAVATHSAPRLSRRGDSVCREEEGDFPVHHSSVEVRPRSLASVTTRQFAVRFACRILSAWRSAYLHSERKFWQGKFPAQAKVEHPL